MKSHFGLAFGCLMIWLASGMAVAQTASERLNAYFEDQWQYELREWPTTASYLGDKRYNDRWPDLSPEAIAKREQHLRNVILQLVSFSGAPEPHVAKKTDSQPRLKELSAIDLANLRMLHRLKAEEVKDYSFQWYLVPLNQREGIQDESSLADAISFQTVKDYEDWIARLKSFPVYMDQTIDLMRAGIAAKIVQPQIVMQRVPGQIKRQIVDDPAVSLYYKPFKSFSPDISADDRGRLEREAQAAIREQIVPAYRKFYDFFQQEYLPACFKGVGAWQLPRGDEFYQFQAWKHTTTSLTTDEIHDIGLAEVARIRTEMERIKEKVGFEGTLLQFFEHLRTSPQFHYTNANDLLAAYQAFCKRVDPELPRVFKKLPKTPYTIEAIPEHMAPDTTTAYYRPPAADGSRPGTFFVNLYKPETRPKYEIAALSLHESVPGHHLQIALATELTDVPEFRKHAHFTAFVEGWGLYSESLGEEMGLYDDPYSKFGQLTYEMWRAVRLVVDTGIHSTSKKWTRDQAIEYFKQNAAKSELDIVNEVDRYIAWPGQALAYKIGELKIKELRKRAETKLGAKFDLREFHNVVLQNGAIPLDVLEIVVNEWIAKSKSQ